MKKAKRLLSVFLAVMAIISATVAVPTTVNAETSGDYTYKVLNDNMVEITKYNGTAQTLSIPSKIDGKKVTSICWGAFEYCESLTSITIPDSITYVGALAFSNCSSLTSVTISDSVTSIGEEAFGYCYSLKSINVDSNNKSYCSDNGVLYNKKKTELIQYPAAKSNKSFRIPNSVTIIDDKAFEYCVSLNKIRIPDSVMSIGYVAFVSCYNLTSITLPNSITSINNFTFENCESLKSINIPDSVTHIGFRSFYGCKRLTGVTIGNSVTLIDSGAFSGCSFTNIKIPDSVKYIGHMAFEHCKSLKKIIIPHSVTFIGDSAFGYYYKGKNDNLRMVKNDNFKIYGFKGTAAEKYAKDNGFKFYDLDKIGKIKQPMSIKAKVQTVSLKKARVKNVTVKKAITVKNNQGAVTFQKVKGTKYLSISKKGVITVKKYKKYKKTHILKIKVKVTAKGNKYYKRGSKTAIVKIKFK